jgi:ketosteroid isomerase-like protein
MKSYNQNNITHLKNFYEAVSRGDYRAACDRLDPNVEWIEPNVAGLWFSGTHRGADAVLKEVFSPTAEKLDLFRVSIKRCYAIGDHVVALGYLQGHSRTTGKELDASTAHVCTLRNGKIVRFETFHDTASMMAALDQTHSKTQLMAA